MTQPIPGRCDEVRAALALALSLDEVSDRQLVHARECPTCAASLARHEAMTDLTARVRAAARADSDLAPAAWARVRAGVDRGLARRRTSLFALLGLAVAVAAAVVFFVMRTPTAPALEPVSGRGLAASGVTPGGDATARPPRLERPAPEVASPAPKPELAPATPLDATEDGVHALVIAAGDRLEGGAAGRTLHAFGRHTLVLEAGAVVTVRRWEATAMDLAVDRGTATFEVERKTPDETFTAWAGDVAVHVKGTIFTVERLASGESRVAVDRGRVLVTRAGAEDVSVSAGERATFPATLAAVEPAPTPAAHPKAPAPAARPKAPAPTPEKVIDIDVGTDRAPEVDTGAGPDVSGIVPALLATVRAGRCVQALNALAELDRGLGRAAPREALWLTAYCKRKLGDVAGSAALFQRYGRGPWPVPTGDELPPLP